MAGRGYQQFLEDHWRHISGEDTAGGRLSPFWPVMQNRENLDGGMDSVLEWLMNTKDILQEEQQPRAYNMVNNIRFYNGMQLLDADRSIRAVDQDSRALNKGQMFVMNHARDFINQSVNRVMKFDPDIDVFPWSNEYSDKLGARYSKRVIDSLFYVNNIRDIFEDVVREGYLCGESFLFTGFNPYIGDLHKPVNDLKDQFGGEITKDPNTGEEMFTTEAGETFPLEEIKRIGDVEYEHPLPWFVLQEPAFRWKDVNYIFKGKVKHIDEIRAENRGVDLSSSSTGLSAVASRSGNTSAYGPGYALGEYMIEWEFFHRGHRFLDKGAYCKFVDGILLQCEDLPFSHRQLPVSRFTDYTDPMNAHGISIFEDLKPPLILYNKLMNLMYRNVAIGAHPKLMVPSGTCNINSLANGPLVVEYEYPMKPELMTFKTIGNEVFTLSDRIMNDTTKFSGTFGISRGDALPNARAASILNFYEEQEEQHADSQIKKYSAFTEKVGKQSIATAGDFYDPEDERTIRIMGKNSRYKVRKIHDVSKLSGPWDIRCKRTTALSESKQGRIDQIQALSTVSLAPKADGTPEAGLFTREQILRMIEVADLPTFFEMATAAVERAESENEDIFEGIKVTAPWKWQAHVIDWNVHFQFMQSREFSDTDGIPETVRSEFLDHMRTHERYMYERAKVSLAFAMVLNENSYFPAVFELGEGNPSISQLIMIHQMPPMPPGGAEAPPAEEAPPAAAPAPEPAAAEGEAPAGEGASGEDVTMKLQEIEQVISDIAQRIAGVEDGQKEGDSIGDLLTSHNQSQLAQLASKVNELASSDKSSEMHNAISKLNMTLVSISAKIGKLDSSFESIQDAIEDLRETQRVMDEKFGKPRSAKITKDKDGTTIIKEL